MISCKKATELASNSLDRKLSLMQRIKLKLHLFICHTCRNYVRQISFIRKAAPELDQHLEQHAHHTLSAEARKAIRSKMDQQR